MPSLGLVSSFLVACGGGSAAPSAGDVAPARSAAPDVAAARAALDAGRPWRATMVVASALRDSQRRTPDVVLLAARAAAGWGGWSEVERLLPPTPWLDSLDAGAGRVLLARAAHRRTSATPDSSTRSWPQSSSAQRRTPAGSTSP